MAYRFTNTDKWGDAWFSELRPIEKLLFNYLCDNCDIAGFIEVTLKKWSMDIGADKPQIEGALKGLQRGLTYSSNADCIYINNFLKHQKNLPINPNNKAHLGILHRFEMYASKFNIQDYYQFIEGASKGLLSPTGIGNGNGIGNGYKKEDIIKTWKNDFETYKDNLREGFKEIHNDKDWIKKQERLNPNVDILLTVEKACLCFWATEAGWTNKKKTKTIDIDWKQTFAKTMDMNKVYKQKQNATEQSAPYHKPVKSERFD